MTLWEVDIQPAVGLPNRSAEQVAADAKDLGIATNLNVHASRGYLVEGALDQQQIQTVATELLADTVVEQAIVATVGDSVLSQTSLEKSQLIYVLPKPGVMDPVAQSAEGAIRDFNFDVAAVRTFRKYFIAGADVQQISQLCKKVLANDSIEQVVLGPLQLDRLQLGSPYAFEKTIVPLRTLNDDQLLKLSKEGQLYLTLVEMQTIQQHFQDLGRDPTDAELESVAQTWSEHCSHKTLAGRIAYQDENGSRQFDNMLKETIFAATQQIRREWGDADWCVSVFEDNAGVVRFNDEYNVVFKVETHNHPSALEPYGGANTGIGGVIRDPMGTGLGAKPICNTDVFCFAPPDTPLDELPAGVLHPRRVMKGVVSGVRDYGNRMGIPTVNGAVYFDRRYLGNPLVYCGNVGLLPVDKSKKETKPGDYIVAIGGRTGRDGIHGATFSSAELTSESESLSGGAVQIGNAITEKMVLDVLLEARDRNLFNAVTDCGAGGFSSAVGEMGEKIGAEVWLDKAPVKYEGLTYTEIWISEAQERMVFSVSPEQWDAFSQLCESEDVEATVIGRFEPTGRLKLKYGEEVVADIAMSFLHDGRPPIIRDATYQPAPETPLSGNLDKSNYTEDLTKILGSLNVASKEWVIRQYDHEVQGGSVIKPLVGVQNDGPGDAAVVRPVLDSQQGVAVSCGMNPYYGDFDTYHMATSAIDEAVRNCVAVGADPSRIAILDNFCWGYTDRPETLGSLVRAALACHDMALSLQTPFISGKDSLNNEFSYEDEHGQKQTIAIPSTLLISAMGQVADVRKCVTMDLKEAGNLLYQVGVTKDELGGSHFSLVNGLTGGHVPKVDSALAKQIFAAVHQAMQSKLIRSCHDLSEGGLAAAIAEMAFAGEQGATINLDQIPTAGQSCPAYVLLFSESNTRFVLEVAPENSAALEAVFANLPCQRIGEVTATQDVSFSHGDKVVASAHLHDLKQAWQAPLAW
ncbi:MAG: phosphoribosylformylglycinamidine synthase subunit PurL [Pirellulaceae bacterium]